MVFCSSRDARPEAQTLIVWMWPSVHQMEERSASPSPSPVAPEAHTTSRSESVVSSKRRGTQLVYVGLERSWMPTPRAATSGTWAVPFPSKHIQLVRPVRVAAGAGRGEHLFSQLRRRRRSGPAPNLGAQLHGDDSGQSGRNDPVRVARPELQGDEELRSRLHWTDLSGASRPRPERLIPSPTGDLKPAFHGQHGGFAWPVAVHRRPINRQAIAGLVVATMRERPKGLTKGASRSQLALAGRNLFCETPEKRLCPLGPMNYRWLGEGPWGLMRMSQQGRWPHVWAVLIAVVFVGNASADDAEALIKRGVELRKKGRDREALGDFQRALVIQATPRAYAQVGLAEQALGLWVSSEGHLARALQEGRDPWVVRNRAVLESAIATVGGHLGTVEVWGEPEGAEVFINGHPAGKFPDPKPVRVVAGECSVEVRADGYQQITRTLDVHAGDLVRENVQLAKLALSPPRASVLELTTPPVTVSAAPAPGQTEEQSGVTSKWWFWTTVGTVLVVGAAAAFVVIRSRSELGCPNGVTCPP